MNLKQYIGPIHCLEATRLVERMLTTGISWHQKWRLRWHQRLCAYCKNYENQSRLIDRALQSTDAPSVFKLDEASKLRILNALEKKSK
ncbi:MAG: hypothetical protein ACK417_05135 [Bacteroidia bacterium]